jgi:ABC-type bacteriocin/lantibiotic exporter with double-glycine peptidase domain
MIKLLNILKLLTKKEKLKSFKLLFFIIINNFAELLSLGALITVIYSILAGKNNSLFLLEREISIYIYEEKNFLLAFLTLSVIFIIKNLVSYQFLRYQFNFLKKIKKRVSHDLYKKYLCNNYLFFTNKNSSELLRNVRIATYYNGTLFNLFTFLSEIVMICVLIITLFLVDPSITIISLIFFLSLSILLHYILKKKIHQYGIIKEKLEISINKSALQTFQSIKEIKIYNSSNFFIKLFDKIISEHSKIEKSINIFQQTPKLIFEVCLILIITVLFFYMNNFNYPKEQYLFILTALSVISLRLIPSLTRIVANLQRLKFFQPSIEILNNQFKDISQQYSHQKNNQLENFQCLKIKNVNFRYEDKKDKVFPHNLDLTINKGEIVGLFGKSGSGKSTLLHLITGLLKPLEGEITINNFNIKNLSQNWLNKISYVPQSVYLFDDNIMRNIFFDDVDFNQKNFERCLKISNLEDLIKSFPEKEQTQVGENSIKISGGQKQMVGIARAIYRNSEILILDEATSSIDPFNTKQILDNIKKFQFENNITIIIISHDIKVMDICDKIFSIKENKLND